MDPVAQSALVSTVQLHWLFNVPEDVRAGKAARYRSNVSQSRPLNTAMSLSCTMTFASSARAHCGHQVKEHACLRPTEKSQSLKSFSVHPVWVLTKSFS